MNKYRDPPQRIISSLIAMDAWSRSFNYEYTNAMTESVEYIQATILVDSHQHLHKEMEYVEQGPDVLQALFNNYVTHDLISMDIWHSVFATTCQLPADIWRNLARFGGAHIYCQSNDVLLADASVVALHSIQSGRKKIALPGASSVIDVISGKRVGDKLQSIEWDLEAPQTRVFHME